jgi:hypothetical protein
MSDGGVTKSPGPRLLVLLPLIGFASGVLTVILVAMGPLFLFAGVIFGAVVAGYLVKVRVLRTEDWAWVTVASGAAYFISLFAAIKFQAALPGPGPVQPVTGQPEAMPGSLFLAGLIGGLFVVGTLLWLRRDMGSGRAMIGSLIGALAGGALGVLGGRLASSFGTAVWQVLHTFRLAGETYRPDDPLGYGAANFDCSLFVVWQTGMAFVIAVLLHKYTPISKAKESHP